MKIATCSLNGQIITGQPGRCQTFIVFEVNENRKIISERTVELTEQQQFAIADESKPHPLDGIKVMIASNVGEGFVSKMARRNVEVLATSLTGPRIAAQCYLAGTLPVKKPRKSKKK